MRDSIVRAISVAGACALAFAYGVACSKYQVFPYEFLRRASAAYAAWRELGDRDLPYTVIGFDREAPARADPHGSGGGFVLVTGGPGQLPSECPAHGCAAWIMDRAGTIVHAWEVDLAHVFDLTGFVPRIGEMDVFPVSTLFLPDGLLVLTAQANAFPYAVGIARVDVDGRVLWARTDHSHHSAATARSSRPTSASPGT